MLGEQRLAGVKLLNLGLVRFRETLDNLRVEEGLEAIRALKIQFEIAYEQIKAGESLLAPPPPPPPMTPAQALLLDEYWGASWDGKANLILEALRESGGGGTIRELSARFKTNIESIRRVMNQLLDDGKVFRRYGARGVFCLVAAPVEEAARRASGEE